MRVFAIPARHQSMTLTLRALTRNDRSNTQNYPYPYAGLVRSALLTARPHLRAVLLCIDARRILLIPEPSPKSASTNASVWSVEGVSSRPGLIARGVRRRPRGVGAPTPRVPASIQVPDRPRHRGRSRQPLSNDTAGPAVDDVAALKYILVRMRSCCPPGLLKYYAMQGNSQIDCVSRPARREDRLAVEGTAARS
jgi:hypothetical protein